MNICKQCQAPLPDYAQHCGRCGWSVNSWHDRPAERDAQSLGDRALAQYGTTPLMAVSTNVAGKDQASPPLPSLSGDVLSGEPWKVALTSVASTPPVSQGTSDDAPTAFVASAGEGLLAGQAAHTQAPSAESVHGAHQQAFVGHAAHHQPLTVHGSHLQAQALHGAHRQGLVLHGRHAKMAQQSCRPSCLTMIVSVSAVVVLVVASIVAVFLVSRSAASNSLTLIGSAISGRTFKVHGSNFPASSKIVATLDNRPLSATESSTIARSSSVDSMSIVQAFAATHSLTGTVIQVHADGTFDLTLHIQAAWQVGSVHILRTYDQHGGYLKGIDFTVTADTTSLALKLCDATTSTGTIMLGPLVAGASQSASSSFTLCTQGTGLLNWSASWDHQQAPWLQLDLAGGQIRAPQSQLIHFTASAATLDPNTYTTQVTFNSQKSPTSVKIKISLLVQAKNVQACMQAQPQALSFSGQLGQGDPAPQSLTLTNCGTTGTWTALIATNDGANWLSVSPDSGTLNGGATQTLSVAVTSAQLAATSYSGTLTFSSGANTAEVAVSFAVSAASATPTPVATPSATAPVASCVALSPTTLNVSATVGGNNPQAPTATLSDGANCAGTPWSATSDAQWLSVNPAAGQLASGGNATIAMGIAIANLPVGALTGHITIQTGAGTQTLTVNLVMQLAPPCLSLRTTTLNFVTPDGGDAPAAQTATLLNGAGCAAGTWSASADAPWVTDNPASGQLTTGGSAPVAVSVQNAGLGVGAHTAHLTFSAGASSVTLTITLTVQGVPCITASASVLSFVGDVGYVQFNPRPQRVVITNCGSAGTVSAVTSVNNGAGWLSASGGGQLAAGSSTTFSVSAVCLATGLDPFRSPYTGTVAFTITTADGQSSTITVNVTFTVNDTIG